VDFKAELITTLEEINDLIQINKKWAEEINEQRAQLEERVYEISNLKSKVAFIKQLWILSDIESNCTNKDKSLDICQEAKEIFGKQLKGS